MGAYHALSCSALAMGSQCVSIGLGLKKRRNVVLSYSAAARRLGAGVEGGHGAGRPAAGLHEFGQGGARGGEILGHADAGAVATETFAQTRSSGGSDDASADLTGGEREHSRTRGAYWRLDGGQIAHRARP